MRVQASILRETCAADVTRRFWAAGALGLVLLFASTATAQPADQLSLTVKPVRGPDGTIAGLEVREDITGGTAGGAPLSFKAAVSAIGVNHIADSITDLKVIDAQGPVPLTTIDDPPVTSDQYAFRHWRAARPATFPVAVSYRIPTEALGERGPPLGMKPAGKGVAGNGIGFLLLPENTKSNSTQVSWDLSDMPARSRGVITAGEGRVDVPGDPSEMFKQWVLAGPAIAVFGPAPSGFHGYLIGDPPFNGPKMLDWGAKAYRVIGDWFKYLGLPQYNLMVRAVNGPSFETGTAGDGRGGSIVNVGDTYWPGQDYADLLTTTFHEMTHQWVGLIKGRGSWYEEGLTVYVSTVLPCRSRLLSDSDCIKQFNHAILNYYTSPGRRWSQQRIDDTPFQQEAIRSVPYGRGALYFASLNAQLLTASKGKRGLREALYPLLIARRDGEGFDQSDWEAMLTRRLGPKAVTEFRHSMIEGVEDIVPPSNAFGPCLKRVSVTLTPKEGGAPVQGYQWKPIRTSSPACAG